MLIPTAFVFNKPINEGILTSALELVLTKFSIFSGRLRSSELGTLEVVCSNAGASLTVKQSLSCSTHDLRPNAKDSDFNIPTKSGVFRPVDLTAFQPQDAPATMLGLLVRDVPLLFAQLTHLKDNASCLVITTPHLLGDLQSIKTVFAYLARAYTHLEFGHVDPEMPVEKPVYYSREALQHYLPTEPSEGFRPTRTKERTWATIPVGVAKFVFQVVLTGGVETVGFYVSKERLAELKGDASKDLPPGQWISTNDALIARLSAVISEVIPAKASLPMSLTVDLRKRLNPKMSDEVIGNILGSVCLESGATAPKVRQAVNNIDQGAIFDELAWLESKFADGKSFACTLMPEPFTEKGPLLISNHDWDFGELSFGSTGQPCWHSPVQPPTPNVVFIVNLDPNHNEGSYVYITLNKSSARRLFARVKAL